MDNEGVQVIAAANGYAVSAHNLLDQYTTLTKPGEDGEQKTYSYGKERDLLREATASALTSIAMSLAHIMHDQCESLHGSETEPASPNGDSSTADPTDN